MNELYAKIAEILEVDSLTPDAVLREYPAWDSLAVLSIIAMLGSTYGVNLVAQDLANVATVGELESLVQARRARG